MDAGGRIATLVLHGMRIWARADAAHYRRISAYPGEGLALTFSRVVTGVYDDTFIWRLHRARPNISVRIETEFEPVTVELIPEEMFQQFISLISNR